MSEVISLQNHIEAQKVNAVYLDNVVKNLYKMNTDLDEYTDYLCAKLRHQFRLPTDSIISAGQNSFIANLNQIQKQSEQVRVRLESFSKICELMALTTDL